MRPTALFVPLFAALLLSAGRCAAAPPEEGVKVTVAVIVANRDGKVDDRLKCVAEEVRKTHPKLTGFHLERMTKETIPLGGSQKFKLVDGQEATIHVKPCKECPNRFCLEITSNALVGEMTYTAICGKYFPLVTDYRTKDKGDRLIIAFKVESCGKK
ncbi:MAG TPA: hypothetical protein VFW33_23975 [Gemmataceae bacterium]|nr:hypothetical protein [Gemmataceae bacterium]